MPTNLCNIAPLRAELTSSLQMQAFAAVSTGCVDTLGRLLAGGVSVNSGDEGDDTLLTLAVSRNDFAMVEFLLQSRADVNLTGVGGKTPLRVAVETAAPLPLVKLLLAAGADPLSTSYDTAQKKDISDLMATDRGVMGNRAGDSDADSILYEVVRAAEMFNIIEYVKDGNRQKLGEKLPTRAQDKTLDVNIYNRDGATALLHACQMGRMDLVEILWHAGVDPNKPHKYDPSITPLSMAKESENPHLIREIERYIVLDELEFKKKTSRLEGDLKVMKPAQIKPRINKN
ncbi:MAG: ankyrin repeat domain-containing protein [Bdellovibrionales bacterium]|jgi:ankyrin repeat protein|nr:ankyrin repeat domain-containing protein [Bdellovibrionales bacterium]